MGSFISAHKMIWCNNEKNKEHIKEQRSKSFLCECGCTIQVQEKTRHRKSQKHINLMKQKEEQI